MTYSFLDIVFLSLAFFLLFLGFIFSLQTLLDLDKKAQNDK